MPPLLVSLRAVSPEDLPIFYEQQRDPLAAQMAAFRMREREAFMAHWEKIMRDESGLLRAVLADGELAGNMLSFLMEGKREVGYWLGRAYWGRGIATRALAAFLLEETRRPLHAWTAVLNTGSRRVLEKNGFRMTGESQDGLFFELPGSS